MMHAVARAPERELLLAYEEALGYAVSAVVRDKDGISAALVVAQLAAAEKARGRTLADRLQAIAERFGAFATDQLTLELAGPDGPERMRAVMARLREDPPAALLGHALECVDDVAAGARRHAGGGEEPLALPRSDVLVLRAGDVRVVVRPSGTEPKLKCYLEVIAPRAADAREAVAALRGELAEVIGA
jgi:phosphomannomutase